MKNYCLKVITLVLVVSVMFSLVACKKKEAELSFLTDEDIIYGIEEYLLWKQSSDYDIYHPFDGTSFDFSDATHSSILYTMDYAITDIGFQHNDAFQASLLYCTNEDRRAVEDLFLINYKNYEIPGSLEYEYEYNVGECGYFIYKNSKTEFVAYYFYENMYLEIKSYDSNSIKKIKQMLNFYNFPC